MPYGPLTDHQKVYLEKYARSHRESIPPLLAAVYISALNWWSYSSELVGQDKPKLEELEAIAFHSLTSSSSRPKLSTVQAGLLLLQNPRRHSAWQLTTQLVAIGQDLGLHRDCTTWQIPTWERGLRKRIAWALYMQSTWSCLIYSRPLHFPPTTQDWTVQPVTSSDFPESARDEDSEEGSTEVEKGRTLFSAMISLTKILAQILHTLHSARAEHEISTQPSHNRTPFILSRVKHLQLALRTWYTIDLPHPLRLPTLSTSPIGKLSSLGWLHTSYFACEMTLHRSLLHSLSPSTDPYLTAICRSAARERLTGALDLFGLLRPEHLQSFWYFSSAFNLALIGVFAGICIATGAEAEREEREWFRERLAGLRWRLRVSCKGVEFLEVACEMLEGSVGGLLKRDGRRERESASKGLDIYGDGDDDGDGDGGKDDVRDGSADNLQRDSESEAEGEGAGGLDRNNDGGEHDIDYSSPTASTGHIQRGGSSDFQYASSMLGGSLPAVLSGFDGYDTDQGSRYEQSSDLRDADLYLPVAEAFSGRNLYAYGTEM